MDPKKLSDEELQQKIKEAEALLKVLLDESRKRNQS
jgi:hypothetical protein